MNEHLDFKELRRQPHWSFSSLNGLLNICSQQYAFRKVYEEKPEFTPVNLVFGKAFHITVRFMYELLKIGEDVKAMELQEHFTSALTAQVERENVPVRFDKDKGFEWHVDKGKQMIVALHGNLDPDDQVIATDVPFRCELHDEAGRTLSKPLIGEFDLVVENRGRLIVVDFKTAAARWPADKCHSDMQATAYLLALRQTVSQNASLFRYDVVTKAKTPTVSRYYTDRTEEDFRRFVQKVQMAERIVESDLYYPHDTCFSCKGCQFRGACAAWQSLQLQAA